jgi:NAD(P)-dependent dehydrogenase (short-subunit alcohol dehydrogenase family)/acyl carrier protein
MDRLMKERPDLVRRTLGSIFERFESGDFQLGPVKSFAAADIRLAFEEMARSQHIGKLVIDFSSGDVEVAERPVAEPIVRSDGCYIVTGGTSGFGMATARWLAEKGAGRIVLASRSGAKAAGVEKLVRELEKLGARAEAMSADMADAAQVRALIARASEAPFRLRGVLHGAMVLEDAMMSDVTAEQFRRVFLPKAGGAWNLAEALAEVPSLEFVVFYSSVSALIGNRGQTSYVAANSLLDALAHSLRARGVPATSINWGALAETGVVARDERIGAILASAGISGVGNRQALDALEFAVREKHPQVGVFLLDWERWQDAHPRLADDPRFRELCLASRKGGDMASQTRGALAEFSKEQRLLALEECLQEVLAETLRMGKEQVPLNARLNEMGVDSLLVLELSLGIKERLGVSFSAMEFLKGPTVRELASMAEGKLWNN